MIWCKISLYEYVIKIYLKVLATPILIFSAEEIECHANWRDGSFYYLVAKIHHAHVMSDEEKYRCFIYAFTNSKNKSSSEIQLAQSGDATCNGLLSPRDGSRTLTLSIGKTLSFFSKWFLDQWSKYLANLITKSYIY